jgi:Ca2+-binding RTX toxin-like protein
MTALTLWSNLGTLIAYEGVVSALPTGGFALTYTDANSVFIQRYDAAGTAVGAPVSQFFGTIRMPDATVTSDGRLVAAVAWISEADVMVMLTSSDGEAAGSFAIPVDSTLGVNVEVQALEGGRFVVAWEGRIHALEPTTANLFMQMFSADGAAESGVIMVNTTIANAQSNAAIAVLGDGGLVVTWRDTNLDYQARIFEADGTPRTGELPLTETDPINFPQPPEVAALSDGGFSIAWYRSGVVYAQRYDDQGGAVGPTIVVGAASVGGTTGNMVDVLALPDGGFVVAYLRHDSDLNFGETWLQRYDADGLPLEAPLMVFRDPQGSDVFLREPRMSLLADGRIIVSTMDVDGLNARMAIVDPREGAVSLAGSAGDDDFWGTDFADTMIGGAGADLLHGDDGDDRLDGGTGADELIGGAGNDSYVVDSLSDVIVELAGEGTDTVETARSSYALGSEVERLIGTSTRSQTLTGNGLDNWITGGAANDHLYGLAGADRLTGGAGADIMEGGAGDDVYYTDNPGDQVVEAAGEGTDTVYACCDYTLGAEVEKLVLQSGALDGTGNVLANTLTGNAAANFLSGLGGDDLLLGGTGNDTLVGGGGIDRLEGGTGNDVLDGGADADLMIGGAGNDTYHVDNAGDVIVEAAVGGADTVQTLASFVLTAGLENLTLLGTGDIDGTGTALGNLITGNAGANHLQGLDGADTLNGADGADILEGGAGNDTLDGQVGDDLLIGGDGYDTYHVDATDDEIVETASGGVDKVWASIDYVLRDHVEQLFLAGSAHLDGVGNALANSLTGNGGDNLLSGLGGTDTLLGGNGDDRLDGGSGGDRLTGGTGADSFLFSDDGVHATSLGGVMDSDQILDLSFAEGDRIDLSAIDADIAAAGDQAFALVAAFTGQAGEATLTYVAASNTTLLRLDVDGDKKIDLQVKITGDATGGAVLDGSEAAGVGGWLL